MPAIISEIICSILSIGAFIISFFSFRKKDFYSIMRICMLQKKNGLRWIRNHIIVKVP